MAGFKEMLLDKIARVSWCLKDPGLPGRQAPVSVNFCIHTEILYDAKTFEALIKFSKNFFALTGKKIAVCVSTPVCPIVKDALDKKGISPDVMSERIRDIAKFAEIGYHGHFYLEGRSELSQISHDNYDRDTVIGQMRAEIGWLKERGIRPKIYIGGWWFLTADIVLELERSGILVDVSVRKGKLNTFGGKYMEDAAIPFGKPFILPPSKAIVEIQSIFGPVMATPIMNGHLSRYLGKDKDEVLSFIFPLHDWDIPKYYRNIWSNVESLHKAKDSIAWMDILDMRALAFK